MIILAIDCAASLCAACLYDAAAGGELGREVRDLGKGHAEHLMDVIGVALVAAGASYGDVGAIAVSVGPGSFTGVRVGVATARGLALALKVPAIGVTTLEAIAAEARAGGAGGWNDADIMAAIDAGRDGIYVGVYDRFGAARYDPAVMTLEQAADHASESRSVLAGSAAVRIAGLIEGATLSGFEGATADIGVYARLAAAKDPADAGRPAPLYLRAPDAKPQAGFILPRRGD
ncbi:tRNA (adenosine(37)-N6)-threonylcarbamoyltransferase complex dimerization subunit type 1 TsaB [Arvimicrobium flavum]|uniref:tRNA (adenosine(37)-N6)-threonylcarbamoyltransferase complex dimerization subunit type 1 TsaB n=1 Tax=Arvimicrobium flavum TaxID=3393320 RepID=UPI00237A2893|nr:tRNA (adenosine(37)-N6)-threonylcarbamoyltransferase complex dimerization subunit type 1 TsaB [Mesorhizobium shangrilense]